MQYKDVDGQSRRFVITDIHPDDFFYEFREDFIGKTLIADFYRKSRQGDCYYYCHGVFEKPVISENIIIQQIVFHAVKLGEPE